MPRQLAPNACAASSISNTPNCFRDGRERVPVRALPVEMDRHHSANGGASGAFEERRHPGGREIKGLRVDVGQHRLRPAAKDRADCGEEAERGWVTTESPGPIPAAASASQRASVPLAQPMAYGARQAAATALSNPSTSGPRTNRCESQTASSAAITSSRITLNWRLKSNMETG